MRCTSLTTGMGLKQKKKDDKKKDSHAIPHAPKRFTHRFNFGLIDFEIIFDDTK